MRNKEDLKVRKKMTSRRTSHMMATKELESYMIEAEWERAERESYNYIVKRDEAVKKTVSFNFKLVRD